MACAVETLSPVRRKTSAPSRRSCVDRLAGVRLERVGQGDRAHGPAVDGDAEHGLRLPLPGVGRPRRAQPGSIPASRQEPLRADQDDLAIDPGADPASADGLEVGDGRAVGQGGQGAGERVLAARLGRRGQAEQAGAVPAVDGDDVGHARGLPSVTVPVLSRTTVASRSIRSKADASRTSSPARAPRPVATATAIGVARPRAHGQAMISTAAAFSTARPQPWPDSPQPRSVATAMPSTIGTKYAEIRSASRWTPALEPCASRTSPDDPLQRALAAEPLRLDQERAVAVERRPRDAVAGAFLDRERLAGQHRLVDARLPLDRPGRRPGSSRPAGRGPGRRGGPRPAGPRSRPVPDDPRRLGARSSSRSIAAPAAPFERTSRNLPSVISVRMIPASMK